MFKISPFKTIRRNLEIINSDVKITTRGLVTLKNNGYVEKTKLEGMIGADCLSSMIKEQLVRTERRGSEEYCVMTPSGEYLYAYLAPRVTL